MSTTPPFTEEQLKCFTRRQIQSLAKVPPTRRYDQPQASNNLTSWRKSSPQLRAQKYSVRRLLEKFSSPDWSTQQPAPPRNVDATPCPRRSNRLAKGETPIEVEISCHAVNGSPPPSPSRRSVTLKSARAKAAPYPTRKHLRVIQTQIHGVIANIAESPPTFHTMDLILPRLERTAADSQKQLSMFAWQGHYFEQIVVSNMKDEPQLWSGTPSSVAKGKQNSAR
ncbi:hypothetical protein FB45DRAFT_894100 [Roridomyces roridus]|uniref:Uncharacterized protein n=1 Tax=Roridomyces roridus TaxID=1738132 RepID=A0AAD7CGD7_9AGAR|nr:hypothetical protein FB45DRAFT_894100 [Roridomyces roridus]